MRNLDAQILRSQQLKQPCLASITVGIKLNIELHRDWIACMGAATHSASIRCYSSSTIITSVWQCASCSETIDYIFSVGESSGECTRYSSSLIFSILRKIWTILATCCHALSCWNVVFCRTQMKSRATSLKTTEM